MKKIDKTNVQSTRPFSILAFPGMQRGGNKNKIGAILAPLRRFRIPFWCPLHFEGAPRDNFPTNSTKMRKVGSKKGGLKKHDLLIDF